MGMGIIWWKRSWRWKGVSSNFGLLTWHIGFQPLLNLSSYPQPHKSVCHEHQDVLAPGCDRLCMEENNILRYKGKYSSSVGITHNFQIRAHKPYPQQFQRCCIVLKKLRQMSVLSLSSTKCWYSTHGFNKRALIPWDMAHCLPFH